MYDVCSLLLLYSVSSVDLFARMCCRFMDNNFFFSRYSPRKSRKSKEPKEPKPPKEPKAPKEVKEPRESKSKSPRRQRTPKSSRQRKSKEENSVEGNETKPKSKR
jgi:hypothetical protein